MSQIQSFVQSVRSGINLDDLEQKLLDWFKFHRCVYCGSPLKETIEILRFEYLGWSISRFQCSNCENTLKKIYSKNKTPKYHQGLGARKAHKDYEIHWILLDGQLLLGSPITSSEDYEEKKVGRKRKFDYRKLDALIWKALPRDAQRLKYGYDPSRITKKVQRRKDASKRLIEFRLEDLELRGLVTKERSLFRGRWFNFWGRVIYNEHPQRIYKAERIRKEFPDLVPFLTEIFED